MEFIKEEFNLLCFICREINGKKYRAFIKEKDLAKNVYEDAVKSGLTAAHVNLK